MPQPRSNKACAADTRAVAGPSAWFMIAANVLIAARECLRASALICAAVLEVDFIKSHMSSPAERANGA